MRRGKSNNPPPLVFSVNLYERFLLVKESLLIFICRTIVPFVLHSRKQVILCNVMGPGSLLA